MALTNIHAGSRPAPADRVRAHPQRLSLRRLLPRFYQAMFALDAAAHEGLDPSLAELVKVRASQLNGCSFCIDRHAADARAAGEDEFRLYALSAWRETSFFTARERAALALAEAVTLLPSTGVPDDVYDEAAALFTEQELAQLIALCVAINAWNRIGVATRMSPPDRA